MKDGTRIRVQTRIRRGQIADAVLAIAGEAGLPAVSVAAVADRVGITPSALYRHYASKEAMLLATLDRIGDRWVEDAEQARQGTGDPLEALRNLLSIHVRMVRESGGAPFLLFSEGSLRNPKRRARLLAILLRLRAALTVLLRQAQEAGRVRRDVPAETLAVMFLGLFQPAATLWHLTRGRFDLTGHARRAWTLFADGIRVPGTPSAGGAPTARHARAPSAPATRRHRSALVAHGPRPQTNSRQEKAP